MIFDAIERHETLAFRGNGARHHDQIGAVCSTSGPLVGVLDDRTLDHAKLVRDLGSLCFRRDEPGSGQCVEIDLDHLAARSCRRD